MHIFGNLLYGCVVALRPGHNGLSHSHYIFIAKLKALTLCCFQYRIGHNLNQIVTLPDNRGANASGNRTNQSFHLPFLHTYNVCSHPVIPEKHCFPNNCLSSYFQLPLRGFSQE